MSDQTTLKLAIVILNWNGRRFLEKFLPSVMQNLASGSQVYVADNGSQDDSVTFLRENYPGIKLLELGYNYGYTGGYNKVLFSIEAEYYVLLNSDMEVTPGWTESVISVMDADQSVAACQPVVKSYYDKEAFEYAGAAGGFIDQYGYPFCRGRLFETLETDHGQYRSQADVFWATGACMFVRASDFRAAGGLDNDFFAHMEEIDLCWRLKRMGRRIVCVPDATVYHVGGGTLPKNNPRKTFLNFRNNMLLLAKNLPARAFYPLMVKRIFLDGLAVVKFLSSGHIRDAAAVFRAGLSVLSWLRVKRREGKSIAYRRVGEVYRSSIVKDYFIFRKRKFSELPEEKFGQL